MNNLLAAISVEFLKARRSQMPVSTALGFALFPLVGGLFMVIIRDPELARKVGLISAKAQITMGAADWPAYLDFMAQGMAVGGIIIFSLIGSWVFGREYVDRTAKDLLALPTARSTIVLAKYWVMLVWSAYLVLQTCLLGLIVASRLDLPPVENGVILQGMFRLAMVALLTLAVTPPIVYFASSGRGYLPAVGVAILAIAFAQIMVITGWGDYFPWAIPAVYLMSKSLAWPGILLVIVTCLVGVFATLVWWERADQS